MSDENEVDYQALANGIDGMLEVVRALVAALISDGFVDREARVIVAAMFADNLKEN